MSAVRTVLDQHQGLDRARAALRLILESSNSTRGYLYLGVSPNMRLAAQLPEDTPPTQSITEHVAGLAKAIHQSTEFSANTDALTGTASMIGLIGAVPDGYGGGLTMHLLVVARSGQPKVIGAVALKLDPSSDDHVGYDLLEAVARSLDELVTVTGAGSAASKCSEVHA